MEMEGEERPFNTGGGKVEERKTRTLDGSRRTKTGHRPARGENEPQEYTTEERKRQLTCMPMTAYMKNSITISRAT